MNYENVEACNTIVRFMRLGVTREVMGYLEAKTQVEMFTQADIRRAIVCQNWTDIGRTVKTLVALQVLRKARKIGNQQYYSLSTHRKKLYLSIDALATCI